MLFKSIFESPDTISASGERSAREKWQTSDVALKAFVLREQVRVVLEVNYISWNFSNTVTASGSRSPESNQ